MKFDITNVQFDDYELDTFRDVIYEALNIDDLTEQLKGLK